ncbi:MAG: hypothetical protein DWQ07_11685 [Chloroflexi bacterium]|nr:MAG: hypothetical protein DWQ07_11685 [Chloroflexota bacterium]MBL1197133.1 hypothetical protein [Chloroflexota bacterium]NOH14428.1 hypothetical protein [Chloroflexota bacterium]
MIGSLFKRLWENIGTLLLAFLLALTVWVSSVVAADPNDERSFPNVVPLEIVGKADDLVIIGNVPDEVDLRLIAPVSVLDLLENEDGHIRAFIDLSNLEPGEYTLSVQIEIDLVPVRNSQTEPNSVDIVLEQLIEKSLDIQSVISGQPALGYQLEDPTLSAATVTVSGPESLVSRVDAVRAQIDVSGARETITRQVALRAVDVNNQTITGVGLSPETVTLTEIITQAGGYRDVAVRVETSGQLQAGYRVTNISVSPPTITIFSSNPELVAELPGFVSTTQLDLSDINDDLEARLALDLPEGVTIVGEQNVLVQVGIAAIESSIPVSIEVEIRNLSPQFSATVSPQSVDVILSGPVAELEVLEEDDVRFFVDLTGLELGTHLVVPQAEILSERVQVESVIPETIEVVIGPPLSPTPTPTVTPTATLIPLPTPTPTPTPE